MNTFRASILIFCCFISFSLFGQSPKAIEADLLKSFKKIDYLSHDNEQANNVFGKKLKIYTEKNPFTLTQDFALLKKEHLDIPTSDDGLFRIYSWDTWTGGTMHFFESIMQYKVGRNIFSILDIPKRDGDARPNYYKVYTFKGNGKTYYISAFLFIESTRAAGNGIRVFTIENGKLIDAKLIKTNSGLHSDLSYDYDFGSVMNIAFEKRPAIHFDNKTNTIDLPLVDRKGNMTNKHILYKFTGQYFEKVKG